MLTCRDFWAELSDYLDDRMCGWERRVGWAETQETSARTGTKLRKVEIAGIASSPNGLWMNQIGRNLTDTVDGLLKGKRYLIHDRNPLFTIEFLNMLADTGVASVKIPPRSPNLSAYAERFVRTIKESCLDRLILFGEHSVRTATTEFIAHYHVERNHQGRGTDRSVLNHSLAQSQGRWNGVNVWEDCWTTITDPPPEMEPASLPGALGVACPDSYEFCPTYGEPWPEAVLARTEKTIVWTNCPDAIVTGVTPFQYSVHTPSGHHPDEHRCSPPPDATMGRNC